MPLKSWTAPDGSVTLVAELADGRSVTINEATGLATVQGEEFGDTIAASRVLVNGQPLSRDERAVADTQSVALHIRAERYLEAQGKPPGAYTADDYKAAGMAVERKAG